MAEKEKLTDRDKVDCLVNLHKTKMNHFLQTRTIEFQVNIAIWTLIILIGYFLNGRIQPSFYISIAIVIFIAHLIWMILIQNSEDRDHDYMKSCEGEIKELSGLSLKEPELKAYRKFLKDIADKLQCGGLGWVLLEVAMTGILLIGVGMFLFQEKMLLFIQSVAENKVNSEHKGIEFEELLTIYGLYLVFVIFCFQEINEKMRHAQDRFRSWCLSRKSLLSQLQINWEIDSWLAKDLIFHLYDFKIKIREAKEKISNGSAGLSEVLKIENERACEDYFGYIYKCLKFKNEHKKYVIWLFCLLMVLKLARDYQDSVMLDVISYLPMLLLMIVVYLMLRGPDFWLNYNDPFTGRMDSLKPEDRKMVKKLGELVKEI